MKQTTFEEFVNLRGAARSHRSVAIMADLLTPSRPSSRSPSTPTTRSCSRASKAESVGRYRSWGRIRFHPARTQRRHVHRAGVRTQRDELRDRRPAHVDGEFQSPFVPDLPRFTGGRRLSTTTRSGSSRPFGSTSPRPIATRRLHDLRHGPAFDHVKHDSGDRQRALRPGEDLRAFTTSRAPRSTFERELERTCRAPAGPPRPNSRSRPTRRGSFEDGVRRIQADIAAGEVSGGSLAALRRRCRRIALRFIALRRNPAQVHVLHSRMGRDAIRSVCRRNVAARDATNASDRWHRRRGSNPDEDQRLAE